MDWYAKVGPLLRLLESDVIRKSGSRFVVFSDADDITPLTNDFSSLVAAFEFYNASVVLGSTSEDWPKSGHIRAFEEAVSPWALRTGRAHGQSSYMAKLEPLVDYLKEIEARHANRTWPCPDAPDGSAPRSRCEFDDQLVWRQLHMDRYPDVKVDSFGKLFMRTDANAALWWKRSVASDERAAAYKALLAETAKRSSTPFPGTPERSTEAPVPAR